MATAVNISSVRSPRRAEGLRIAHALLRRSNARAPTEFPMTCTSLDELSPTFSINGVRYDEPKAALRHLGRNTNMGRSGQSLYPEGNEAACQVDRIVNTTDTFLKDFMAAVEEQDTRKKGYLVTALNGTFAGMLTKLHAGKPQARGTFFCVGKSLTIADLQVYAVLAVVDTMPLEGFNTVIGSGAWRAANNAMLVQCRVIASNEQIQEGKQYYLAKGSDI
nr:glutathione S-transferase [Saccharina japonica]